MKNFFKWYFVALAIWTVVMVVAWYALFVHGKVEAVAGDFDFLVAILVFDWILGAFLLLFVGVLIATLRRPGPRMICTNCGATLLAQWRRGDGYACRACGQTTGGRMSDGSSPP